MHRIPIIGWAIAALASLAVAAALAMPAAPADDPRGPRPVIDAPAGTFDLSAFKIHTASGPVPDFKPDERVPVKYERSGPVAAIVGGKAGKIEDNPGAVLIEAVTEDSRNENGIGRRGYQQCTGVAVVDLPPDYIMTAGHCVEPDALHYVIYYGGESGVATRETMRKTYAMTAYICPDYVAETLAGDCALLKLVKPMDLQPHEMGRLATKAEYAALKIGDPVIVAGWGTTEGGDQGGDKASPFLKEAVQVIDALGTLTTSVRSPSGAVEGVCQGDSGGALRSARVRRIVLGLLSTVYKTSEGVCRKPGYRATFTSSQYFRFVSGI